MALKQKGGLERQALLSPASFNTAARVWMARQNPRLECIADNFRQGGSLGEALVQ
jgi:hypothetical protein